MDIWAVANQKGGVGKTTTVVCCAGLLGEAGRRVLMVDLDPQSSLTAYFRHDSTQLSGGTFELFREQQPPTPAAVLKSLLPTALPGVMLWPATPGLGTVERRVRSEEGVGLRLARALAPLREHFHHVLIDTPPVLGVLLINALAASGRLVLPVQTDYLAIKGLERMAHTLGMVARARRREPQWSVLPTMYDSGSEAAERGLRALQRTFGDRVANAIVPFDNVFREASMRGAFPSLLAPASKGVNAYQTLLHTTIRAAEHEHGSAQGS